MIANAHIQLHAAINPNVNPDSIYWYGTSTLNQKIESWWRQMSKCQTAVWKFYFDGLRDSGEFNRSYSDQIAMLYVYLPIVREEVYQFVDLWNAHNIRYQRNRPDISTGKPVMLYYNLLAGIFDYGLQPDLACLERLKADVSDYDPDEYLPQPTLHWCQAQMADIDIENTITFDRKLIINENETSIPLHRVAYLYLREAAKRYLGGGGVLALCKKPEKTYQWIPDGLAIEGVDLNIDEFLGEENPEYIQLEDRLAEDNDDTDSDI